MLLVFNASADIRNLTLISIYVDWLDSYLTGLSVYDKNAPTPVKVPANYTGLRERLKFDVIAASEAEFRRISEARRDLEEHGGHYGDSAPEVTAPVLDTAGSIITQDGFIFVTQDGFILQAY